MANMLVAKLGVDVTEFRRIMREADATYDRAKNKVTELSNAAVKANEAVAVSEERARKASEASTIATNNKEKLSVHWDLQRQKFFQFKKE